MKSSREWALIAFASIENLSAMSVSMSRKRRAAGLAACRIFKCRRHLELGIRVDLSWASWRLEPCILLARTPSPRRYNAMADSMTNRRVAENRRLQHGHATRGVGAAREGAASCRRHDRARAGVGNRFSGHGVARMAPPDAVACVCPAAGEILFS